MRRDWRTARKDASASRGSAGATPGRRRCGGPTGKSKLCEIHAGKQLGCEKPKDLPYTRLLILCLVTRPLCGEHCKGPLMTHACPGFRAVYIVWPNAGFAEPCKSVSAFRLYAFLVAQGRGWLCRSLGCPLSPQSGLQKMGQLIVRESGLVSILSVLPHRRAMVQLRRSLPDNLQLRQTPWRKLAK